MNDIRPPFWVLSQNEAEVLLHASGEQGHFLVSQLPVVDLLVVEPLASTPVQTLCQEVSNTFEIPFFHADHVGIEAAVDPSPRAVADEPLECVQTEFFSEPKVVVSPVAGHEEANLKVLGQSLREAGNG